jgi:hypothetical protein
MCRPRREFRAESFALEGRLLLAISPQINVPPTVDFEGTTIPGTTNLSQVVTQQDGEATVSLSGYIQPGTGTLQVVVATDPSSPAVGVNVGAVAQTVTFANGASQATVTVPILAGAPNTGEVDVDLTITPIDPPPDLRTSGPLELRILASDAMIPPKIVSVQGTPQGIVLTFSKPMDPSGASNVNNYFVRATKTSTKDNQFLGLIDNATQLLHFGRSISISVSTSTHTVPLQAAEYDPATNSVTLVPKRKLTYSADIIVTQGHQTKVSGRPGHQSNPGPALTDLEGNLINGDTTPGKFGISVGRGTRTLSGNSATVNGVE